MTDKARENDAIRGVDRPVREFIPVLVERKTGVIPPTKADLTTERRC
ncbi:hypothetical protein ACFV2H_27510 [Streptomyces sp. NPDC059629]